MADLLFEATGTNQEASVGGATTSATVGQDLTTSLDVNVQSLRSRNETTGLDSGAQASKAADLTPDLEVSVQSLSSTQLVAQVTSGAQASKAADLTPDLEVSVQSLSSTQLVAQVTSGAQASKAADLTPDLEVSVQSLSSTQLDTQILSGSQASIGADKTTSLDVSVASLRSLQSTTSLESGAQATIGADKTADLSVNVGVVGFTTTEPSVVGGATTRATIGQDLTPTLQVNVSILGFESTEPSVVGGAATRATIGQDLTATLNVNVNSLRSTQLETGIESGAQASKAADLTADLEVSVQSLSSTQLVAQVTSGAQASLAADLTPDLEVSVQSLTSTTTQTGLESGSQASIAADLTASLDVSKDSLTSTVSTGLESGAQASIAADLTPDLEVSVQSLTSTTGQTGLESGSQASIGADKTADLSVNVSVLGFESTEPSVIGGADTAAVIPEDLVETEAGQVTGAGVLATALFLTADLEVLPAETNTVATSPDVTIKGTETRSAALDIAVAATYTRTTDLDVTIKGTETRATDLEALVQGTTLLTPDLDVTVAVTNTVSVDLDQLVKAIQFRFADLDVNPSPTREFKNPLDLLIKGEFTRTVSMSMALQGTVLLTPQLDMFVLRRLPFSLLKLWGNVTTRYFGGTASDGNFFEHFEPHPAAVINEGLGVFNTGDRNVTYSAPNTIPTPAVYDKYSIPLAAGRATDVVGFRMLLCFELRAFGPNNILLLGGFTGTNDPITDIANQDFIGMSIEADKNTMQFRAWAGGVESSRSFALGLPVSRFLSVPLLLEIETVSATSALADFEFRLFDRSQNLDRPLFTIPVQTSIAPTITHVAMTSLGRRTVELPTSQPDMNVELSYVDVEVGTGVLYQPGYTDLADAKLRDYQDRPPITLSNDGIELLTDALTSDQGYWRLDTSVASTLSFSASGAAVEGAVYAEPTGSGTWSDYRASVEVRPGFTPANTNPVGLSLYGTGEVLTGNFFALSLIYQSNSWLLYRIVSGLATVLASGSQTLDPNVWHTLRLNSDTNAAGQTLLHAFIDDVAVAQVASDTVLSGAVVLLNTLASPVTFRNLNVRGGVNDVFVALADAPTPLSDTEFDSVIVDSSDPIITIETFTTDSPVLVPDAVNPAVVKGSLNPGFSGVAMQWYCTHVGTWTLRVDSTGATNGTELKSGTYTTAFASVGTGWDFSELPQVDGTYDVTLYLTADSGKVTAKKLGLFILP